MDISNMVLKETEIRDIADVIKKFQKQTDGNLFTGYGDKTMFMIALLLADIDIKLTNKVAEAK